MLLRKRQEVQKMLRGVAAGAYCRGMCYQQEYAD